MGVKLMIISIYVDAKYPAVSKVNNSPVCVLCKSISRGSYMKATKKENRMYMKFHILENFDSFSVF